MVLTQSLRLCDPEEFGKLVLKGVDKKMRDLQESAKADAGAASETPGEQEEFAAQIRDLGESAKKEFGDNMDGITAYTTRMVSTMPAEFRTPAMGLYTQLIRMVKVWFTSLNPVIMRLGRNLGRCKELFGKVSKYAWAAIKIMFKFFLNPVGLRNLGAGLR